MKRFIFLAVAAIGLAACGEASETAESLQSQASAAIDESALVGALGLAVDEQAVEDLARGAIDGAVNDAIREVVPAEEMAVLGAIVDEEALAKSLDGAIDGQALGGAVKRAIDRVTAEADLAR